jgi:hypothetical protein
LGEYRAEVLVLGVRGAFARCGEWGCPLLEELGGACRASQGRREFDDSP